MARVVCRFSCGITSAVATWLAINTYGHENLIITYSDPKSEHPDNRRFLHDCEKWFDHEIKILENPEYIDTWDVWEKNRFIVNRFGAECTGVLKREPTYADSRLDDILVLGLDIGEKRRAEKFRNNNPEINLETPLIDCELTKKDCVGIVSSARIELPMMYKLGYKNNNCIGCPKGGMGYWNKIRMDFPDTFERMAALQRKLGPGSFFFVDDRKTLSRISLDDLDPARGRYESEIMGECGVICTTDD